MKGLGVRAGVPDVIAIKDGRTYALELKAEGGRLSEAQERAFARCWRDGDARARARSGAAHSRMLGAAAGARVINSPTRGLARMREVPTRPPEKLVRAKRREIAIRYRSRRGFDLDKTHCGCVRNQIEALIRFRHGTTLCKNAPLDLILAI